MAARGFRRNGFYQKNADIAAKNKAWRQGGPAERGSVRIGVRRRQRGSMRIGVPVQRGSVRMGVRRGQRAGRLNKAVTWRQQVVNGAAISV